MAINNKSTFTFFRVLLIILILIFLSDITLSQIPGYFSNYFDNHIPAIISGFFIIVLASARVNYFSYEDDYEIIHIKSRPLVSLIGKIDRSIKTRYEFPKRIICDFEIKQGMFQKVIVIHLKTNNGVKRIRRFDLSFVPLKKFKYVVNSLEKVSLQNKDKDSKDTEMA